MLKNPLLHWPTGPFFVLVFVAAMLLPRLAPQGMFLDGIFYATIARNLAIGDGSWWSPQFNGPFIDHPPLQFWLQSFLFRVLGDHFWVERLYCLGIAVLTVRLILLNWRLLFRADVQRRGGGWTAVLLWYSMPTVTWAMPFNMLEGTLGVFTLGAVATMLRAEGEMPRRAVGWAALSGMLVFGAFLTKGPVGLFPLALPVVRWAQGGWRSGVGRLAGIRHIAMLAFVFSTALLLLWAYPPARHLLQQYFAEQVVKSLQGQREMGERGWAGHFFLVPALLKEAGVALAVTLLLFGMGRRRLRAWIGLTRASVFPWWMWAAATLPLLISVKQRAYYLLPGLPWLAMGLAAWVQPYVQAWGEHLSTGVRQWINALLVVAALAVLGFSAHQFGRPGRDQDLLRLTAACRETIPPGATLLLPGECAGDYALHAYLARYGHWPWTTDSAQATWAVVRTCCPRPPYADVFLQRLSDMGWRQVAGTPEFEVWKR